MNELFDDVEAAAREDDVFDIDEAVYRLYQAIYGEESLGK